MGGEITRKGASRQSGRWNEIGDELENFLSRGNTSRNAIALDAGQIMGEAQAEQTIFDELLAGEAT